MLLDWVILYGAVVLAVLLLLLFIPRDKIRIALVIFVFKQVITWILGVIVVEFGLLSYPVRIFDDINRTSFIFEYVVYPAISSIFIVHYPEYRGTLLKLGYYAIYCSVMSGIEVILEHTTRLIHYIHWDWYWTWLSLFITFWLSRQFYKWYFLKLLKDPQTVSE